VAEATEIFDPAEDTVALKIGISNFGKFRVVVDGFKIAKDQVRRLLPVLAGEGLGSDILEEGARNIRDHLEELGYPEAEVSIRQETDTTGGQVVRYVIASGRKTTVAYVRFRGNEVFSGEDLQAVIPIQRSRFLQKSAYSISKLDSAVDAIVSFYQSKGYLRAKIIPLIEPVQEGEKLGVTFDCEEGPLSRTAEVRLQGNRLLPSGTLENSLSLRTEDRIRPSLPSGTVRICSRSTTIPGFSRRKSIIARSRPAPKIPTR